MNTSLTEEQITTMKDNCTIVILTGCDDKAATDKSLPTTSYLIECQNEDKKWNDIVMGDQVTIFDSYHDVFGKNVIQKIKWTEGTMNPKTWGHIKATPPRKKRKRKSSEE